MSLSVEQHVGDLKMLIAYMSDPEKAKESASRSDEERKKRWAETISKTATKYGFDSSEAYLAAVKKLEDEVSSEDYQNIIYKVGKEVFPNDLRQWFISLYQILFGSNSGPRLGSFFNVYGKKNVLFLLEETVK